MTAQDVLSRRGLIVAAGGLAVAGPLVVRSSHAQTRGGVAGDDPFEMLTDDHRQVEALFAQIQQTPGSAVQDRQQLLKQLKQALTAHGMAEENVLYPILARQEENVPKATELFTEHAAIKTYLFNLSHADARSEAWMAKLAEFRNYVLEHAGDEEQNVFPAMRSALSREQVAMLGREMQREKQQVAMR